MGETPDPHKPSWAVFEGDGSCAAHSHAFDVGKDLTGVPLAFRVSWIDPVTRTWYATQVEIGKAGDPPTVVITERLQLAGADEPDHPGERVTYELRPGPVEYDPGVQD